MLSESYAGLGPTGPSLVVLALGIVRYRSGNPLAAMAREGHDALLERGNRKVTLQSAREALLNALELELESTDD